MRAHQSKIGLESVSGVNWQGKRILDVGCGDGKLTLELLRSINCQEIVGVDIDESKIKKAIALAETKGKDRLSFCLADASNLNQFQDGSFDAVFSNIAFHQFDDKETSLKEIYRVLKSGGQAVINFIEEKSAVRQEMAGIVAKAPFNQFIETEGRGKKISREEFEMLAKRAGFSEITSTSKDHTLWYPSVDSLLAEYRNLDVVFPKLKVLPLELQELLWEKLEEKFLSRKTPRGFGETWKVVFARLVK